MHRMIPKTAYFGPTSDQQLNLSSYRLANFCICIYTRSIPILADFHISPGGFFDLVIDTLHPEQCLSPYGFTFSRFAPQSRQWP